AWAIAVLLLLAAIAARAEPMPEPFPTPVPGPADPAPEPASVDAVSARAFLNLVRRDFGLPQLAGVSPVNLVLVNGTRPSMTGSSINVNCTGGCSSSAGFPDNSTFTIGTTPILNIGALYTTSAPSISSGNAGRVRMDANSYLAVDCIVGCSASAGFADN